jgi:hypothetical protein
MATRINSANFTWDVLPASWPAWLGSRGLLARAMAPCKSVVALPLWALPVHPYPLKRVRSGPPMRPHSYLFRNLSKNPPAAAQDELPQRRRRGQLVLPTLKFGDGGKNLRLSTAARVLGSGEACPHGRSHLRHQYLDRWLHKLSATALRLTGPLVRHQTRAARAG